MKKYIYFLLALFVVMGLNACSPEDDEPTNEPPVENPDNSDHPDNPDEPDPDDPENPDEPAGTKTLIVYYSFSNNVHTIVNDLRTQIEADLVRVEPAEEGLDYAANNYAIGSALISAIRNNPGNATSYPAIKTTIDNLNDYDRIIVAAPLWWSNMAAPLQTFLFNYGSQMASKRIGLIVSSSSSGISGVEADAKRLIPGGNFLEPSLLIRSSQTSNCHSMIANWLDEIN